MRSDLFPHPRVTHPDHVGRTTFRPRSACRTRRVATSVDATAAGPMGGFATAAAPRTIAATPRSRGPAPPQRSPNRCVDFRSGCFSHRPARGVRSPNYLRWSMSINGSSMRRVPQLRVVDERRGYNPIFGCSSRQYTAKGSGTSVTQMTVMGQHDVSCTIRALTCNAACAPPRQAPRRDRMFDTESPTARPEDPARASPASRPSDWRHSRSRGR